MNLCIAELREPGKHTYCVSSFIHTSRKCEVLSSGRKQSSGCLGVGVRREECKKRMGKLFRVINVHYLNCRDFMGVHLCHSALYCTFFICAVYCASFTLIKIFFK